MRKLGALWAGKLPLGEAFWSYAVLIGLAVNLTTSLLFLALISADRPIAALLVGYAMSVPYNLVALVGVWRSASNHPGNRLQADLARIATLLLMIVLSLT